MYETIQEVNHKKPTPVFEYFEDIPTIVAHPPTQERFESLYNSEGAGGNIKPTGI